ncbi:MAG: SPOR domain-containing protein [Gemmatimonadota bacterium]
MAAVRLAQEGQGDSARVQVKRIIDVTPAASPLYAEALYAAGLVAANTGEMERQFQRLVVEFNGSSWSDDALLKLMQLNFARGDLAAVVRTAERLASDYPQSEVIPEASLWAARAYFRQANSADGCRWLTNGLARSDTLDVELRNGLTFLHGRCDQPASGQVGQRASDSAAAPAPFAPVPDTTRTAPAPQRPSAFSIQVASSSTQALADDLIRRLARDGFANSYIVKDGAAFKVRVGRLPQRADADTLLARVRAKYPQAFIVEERP